MAPRLSGRGVHRRCGGRAARLGVPRGVPASPGWEAPARGSRPPWRHVGAGRRRVWPGGVRGCGCPPAPASLPARWGWQGLGRDTQHVAPAGSSVKKRRKKEKRALPDEDVAVSAGPGAGRVPGGFPSAIPGGAVGWSGGRAGGSGAWRRAETRFPSPSAAGTWPLRGQRPRCAVGSGAAPSGAVRAPRGGGAWQRAGARACGFISFP